MFGAFQLVVVILKVVLASVFIPGTVTVDTLLFQQFPSEIVPPIDVCASSRLFVIKNTAAFTLVCVLHDKFSKWRKKEDTLSRINVVR
jgi:hypothetical protein